MSLLLCTSGLSRHTVSFLTEIMLDGPQSEDALATSTSCDGEVCLEPTDLCREFAKCWVDLHGRRFRVYKEPRKGVRRTVKKGSIRFVARGTAHTMDKLAARGALSPLDMDKPTVLGFKRRVFWGMGVGGDAVADAELTKEMKQFKNLTKQKKTTASLLASLRTSGANPYRTMTLKPALRLGLAMKGNSDVPPLRRRVKISDAIQVLDSCREAVKPTDGYWTQRPDKEAATPSPSNSSHEVLITRSLRFRMEPRAVSLPPSAQSTFIVVLRIPGTAGDWPSASANVCTAKFV